MLVLRDIVVPVDFEPTSYPALTYARDLAWTFRARLHVLHVLEDTFALPAGTEGSLSEFPRLERQVERDVHDRLNALLVETHRNHARPRTLTAAELETLGLVKNGLLMKEIACMLGVSESAIKQRLKNARVKLNVKTGSQAAARATMLGMI